MTDDAARERIQTALSSTLLVEAAAGTGKTTALVGRIVATLAAGADVARIAALTFTDKAAGELKLRLRAGLERARKDATGGRASSVEAALDRLEDAHVSTIHTFCQELLRERPVEAGVDPRFVPCTDAEARGIFDEAFARWFERSLRAPPPGLRRALARPDASAASLSFAARTLSDHRMSRAPWVRRPWDRDAALEDMRAAVIAAAGPCEREPRPGDPLRGAIDAVRAVAHRIERGGLGPDVLEAGLAALAVVPAFRQVVERPRGSDPALVARCVALAVELDDFLRAAAADLAFELHEELSVVGRDYQALKARRGVLDMSDLVARAYMTLRHEENLRVELASRFERIFVDEFQDTDAVQIGILMMLATDGAPGDDPFAGDLASGKLFAVGDPKQSIYRFRGADLAVYEAVRRAVVRSGGEVLTLTSSFRAVGPIQALVNATFAPLMGDSPSGVHARYVPLAPVRSAISTQPSVIALPVPEPYGKQRLARTAIVASLPPAIVAFIEWLLKESGFTIDDPHRGARVPVEPRHIAVLFSRTKTWRQSLVAPIARGLSEREIPHLALGSVALSGSDEGRALLNALHAIERTDDGIAVYATLHGPLFGFDDALLFELATLAGSLDPERPRPAGLPAHLKPLEGALDLLLSLHRQRNRRPVAETLFELLSVTRAHVGFALSPAPEQALLVVASLERKAAAHERAGGLSFRSFVDALDDEERGRELSDDESDGVRLLTVHAAKGLEFPIVILADPTSKPAQDIHEVVDARAGLAALRLAGCAPWELLERDIEERERSAAELVRLAYVAATRARDLLVVPVVADDPSYPGDGWLAPLSRTMRPIGPRQPRPVPGCRFVGHDTVVSRPVSVDDPLAPGLYATEGGDVAYFDLAALRIGGDRPPIRSMDLIAKGGDEAAAHEEERAFERFVDARKEALARGSAARFVVTTPTALGALATHEAAPHVTIERCPRAAGRPGGKRFGIVVHETLASIALDADDAGAAELCRAIGRVRGATEEEIAAAVVVVQGALGHALVARARAAGERGLLRRETPITWASRPGEIVDGVVDLAFQEEGRWVVVDYKTDDPERLEPRALGAYRAQVDAYLSAISAATGKPAAGVLLFV